MVDVLSPGAQRTPYKATCPDCDGPLYGYFYSGDPVGTVLGYTLRKSLVRMRRILMFGQRCDYSGQVYYPEVAMRPKVDDRPIRKNRVYAIRNLRRNGYRFFDWEKPYVQHG